MEDWELDFEWLKVRHKIRDQMGRTEIPDLNAVLFLVGVQELGRVQEKFTKEEKRDLMHIAVCRLLSYEGYYEFEGRDADGWPHYKQIAPFTTKGLEEQERLIKEKLIQYFADEQVI
ncbi:MAG: hypothetical protein ACOYOA_14790 [Saprospiraceae bacterium]|jgi:hypothetical protein